MRLVTTVARLCGNVDATACPRGLALCTRFAGEQKLPWSLIKKGCNWNLARLRCGYKLPTLSRDIHLGASSFWKPPSKAASPHVVRRVESASFVARGFACGALFRPTTVNALANPFAAVTTNLKEGGKALSEKLFDLVGTGSFTLIGGLSLAIGGHYYARQVLVTSLVTLWSARLASALFTRILREEKDSRFDKVRDNPPKFMLFWTAQAVWVWVTLLPVMMLNANPANATLGLMDVLSLACWAGGFAIESIADHQKKKFREDPANKGRWIDTGLWRYSQHPNYFGEIVMWSGIFGLSAPALQGFQVLAGVLSPVLVMHLLLNISGVPLQEAGNKKKGWYSNPAYLRYRERTPLIIPWPWKGQKST